MPPSATLRLAAILTTLLLPACSRSSVPRAAEEPPPVTTVAHVHAIEEALASFHLPPGYHLEVVAYEPMVEDPVAIDFDADGRMYVAEMRGYMPGLSGEGEDVANGRIVVLEDTNDDGLMDRRTVFMDSIVLPRSVKPLDDGVLVAATPYLWLARDTDGDLRADSLEVIRDDYGTRESNPEHNANGLLWGIDNWIHNARYAGAFRLRPDGSFEFRETPSQGQWGISMDEYGRLYRNSNEDPLRTDLIPSHYATRNPNQGSVRGVYERLTTNVPVWPGRATPAVNRGYRDRTLRPDSTLAHYTAAGSPVAYVGDRLPEELKNTVFISESAGNLVGQFIVEEGEGAMPTARRAEEEREFVTSTDQRFRPVNLATAPDGTLYVVDMYRGIIQHRTYITAYLEEQIRAREMEAPVGLGRIYRVVHESTRRDARPRLSSASPEELVETLTHPNGWWRITAQRLLVERQHGEAAAAVRELLRSSGDERVRLHAIWTLNGLEAADRETIVAGLSDASEHVRAAAIRIAEPLLREGDRELTSAVLRLVDDPAALVRRQVAATAGELPRDARDEALVAVASRAGGDPVVADMVVSGLHDRELPFLEQFLAASPPETAGETVRALAATVARSREPQAIQRLLALATASAAPRWQTAALLGGIGPAGGRGGGGWRGGGGPVTLASLPARPAALLALAQGDDEELAALAGGVADLLGWPGKPAPTPTARELTPGERQLLARGEEIYAGQCAACHQADGEGLQGVARSLVGSPLVLGNATVAARIVLHGKEGEMLMPALGGTLNDEEIAAVLTYVRRSWGNEGSPVSPAQVEEIRGEAGNRRHAWTEAEIQAMMR